VNSYQQLAATVLRCLHLEVRCQVLHQLRLFVKEDYLLEQPENNSDPNIISLNGELVVFDEEMANHLPDPQHL
jgi:exocyst complex component 4